MATGARSSTRAWPAGPRRAAPATASPSTCTSWTTKERHSFRSSDARGGPKAAPESIPSWRRLCDRRACRGVAVHVPDLVQLALVVDAGERQQEDAPARAAVTAARFALGLGDAAGRVHPRDD